MPGARCWQGLHGQAGSGGMWGCWGAGAAGGSGGDLPGWGAGAGVPRPPPILHRQ